MTEAENTVAAASTPPVVDRATFRAALAEQVAVEKELTKHNDRVSARRRRLPMVEVEDYRFSGPDGTVRLSELFGPHRLLIVQNVMFGPDWETGCPGCTWAVDNLPAAMSRIEDEGVAFALISQAPSEKLERYRTERGWPHRWVSSHDTGYHYDWGWTERQPDGSESQQPGYSFYLLHDGVPYLTYATTRRGGEPFLPTVNLLDRLVYGRQQDWEDSPAGWPQHPTYG